MLNTSRFRTHSLEQQQEAALMTRREVKFILSLVAIIITGLVRILIGNGFDPFLLFYISFLEFNFLLMEL